MSKNRANPLKVVPGGLAVKDGYVCSKLFVACVIDVWKNGKKVDEFVTQAGPVLSDGEGETAFGSAVDKMVAQLIERTKLGQLAPEPPPTE